MKEHQDLDEVHHSNIFRNGSSLPQDEFNYGPGAARRSEEDDEITDFDQVVGKLDPLGKYQRMLLYWVISPICAVQSIVSYNSIFMLFSPEHWCAGPGREKYDDVEEYKLINIPMHNTSAGPAPWKYSSCSVYGRNGSESRCEWGWEFDKVDYEKTMSSEYEWVCDNGSIPPNALLMSVIGNALGILGCGFLSDNWGRKPAAFLAIFINTLFRFLSLFTGTNYFLFYICQFIVGLAQTNIYVVPTLISAELSTKDARAEVYAVTWTASLVGLCALPTISWLCGDWFLIGFITASTGACMLMSFSIIPESPRWLLRKGRLEECVQVLEKIQVYNNKARRQSSQQYSSTELRSMLEKVLSTQQQNGGDGGDKSEKATFSVLFKKFNLARNTLLLTVCWSVNTLIYGIMTFNATHMSGSHFTNFFLLGIIELPSGYIGGYLADTVGRRWTQTFAFVFSAVSCFGTSLFVSERELEIGLALFTKLVATISFIVVYLQAAEFFPTELRSTGCGIASTTANMVTISAPVIAQMSASNPAFPWIFNGILSILGVIAASLLPETLNVPLPETVEEANNIGRRTKTCPTSSVDT